MRNLILNFSCLLFLTILGIALYGLTLKGIKGNVPSNTIKNNLDQATKPLELSPERGRFILTKSLAENKSFALTPELADAAFPDVGYYDGKYYIFFPPGISLIAMPSYLWGSKYDLGQVGAFAAISIFAILNLVLIFLISEKILKLAKAISLFNAVLFGFGTISWSYAITMYQHQITTFFMLYSFFAVWKYKQGGKFKWIWATGVWFCYGYSLFVDYPNAILLSPLIIYFLLSSISISKAKNKINFSLDKTFVLTMATFIILIFLHGYYNYTQFGSWTKISGSLKNLKTVREEEKMNKINPPKTVSEAANSTSVESLFKEENLPNGFAILFFSPDRGLFLYAPIFALAILGLYSIRKRINLEIGILLSIIVVNVFLYSSWGDPWGGWAFGPRYLIPSLSILSFFVGICLQTAKYKIATRFATFILFAYSSFVSLLGALTTNQVPPKIEADFLKMKYNFLLNWDYLVKGKSSSFYFNEYAAKQVNLSEYFLLIYLLLMIIAFFLLFVVPLFKDNES